MKKEITANVELKLKSEMDKYTWIKWYPLVISSAKCF